MKELGTATLNKNDCFGLTICEPGQTPGRNENNPNDDGYYLVQDGYKNQASTRVLPIVVTIQRQAIAIRIFAITLGPPL